MSAGRRSLEAHSAERWRQADGITRAEAVGATLVALVRAYGHTIFPGGQRTVAG